MPRAVPLGLQPLQDARSGAKPQARMSTARLRLHVAGALAALARPGARSASAHRRGRVLADPRAAQGDAHQPREVLSAHDADRARATRARALPRVLPRVHRAGHPVVVAARAHRGAGAASRASSTCKAHRRKAIVFAPHFVGFEATLARLGARVPGGDDVLAAEGPACSSARLLAGRTRFGGLMYPRQAGIKKGSEVDRVGQRSTTTCPTSTSARSARCSCRSSACPPPP